MSQFKVKVSVNIAPPFSLSAEELESCILKTFSGVDPQPYDFEIGQGRKEKPIYFFFVFEAENRFKALKRATSLRNKLQENWKQNTDQKVSWKIGEISRIELSLIRHIKNYFKSLENDETFIAIKRASEKFLKNQKKKLEREE